MRATIVILLLVIFTGLAISTILQQGPTADELAHHVAAGYSYVKLIDFRMNPAQPPLIREIMGLPLLGLDLKLPTDHSSWQTNDSPEFGRLFFYVYNNNPDRIIFYSRLPMIALSVVLAIFIFIWCRKIYGQNSAIFALFLYVFSPAVLGNAGLAMTDMGGSLFIFLAVYCFWRFLKKETFLNLFVTGVCFGLALASKHSSIILYPLFLLFIIPGIKRSSPGTKAGKALKYARSIMAIWLIGNFTLWATYLFEFKPLLMNVRAPEEKIAFLKSVLSAAPFLNKPGIVERIVSFAKEVPIPFSTYIISFLGIIRQAATGGQKVYLMGQLFNNGSKIYYIIDFFIKTPLPMIIFIILSVVSLFIKKRAYRGAVTNLFLLLPIFLFFLFASFSKLQGGVRYLLPAYPFLFIWISNIINIKFTKAAAMNTARFAVGILSVWYLSIALTTHPNYLAYFNDFVGGPNGFGHKITHDCDWGQDLPALARYLHSHKIDRIKLAYFGTADPEYYGIKYKDTSPADQKSPQRAVYAISARYLDNFEWTKEYSPIARAGYTIFIYDFRSRTA